MIWTTRTCLKIGDEFCDEGGINVKQARLLSEHLGGVTDWVESLAIQIPDG